jgi:hypothetical protein
MMCDDEADGQVVDFAIERKRRYAKMMGRRRKREYLEERRVQELREALSAPRNRGGWPKRPSGPDGPAAA